MSRISCDVRLARGMLVKHIENMFLADNASWAPGVHTTRTSHMFLTIHTYRTTSDVCVWDSPTSPAVQK